MIKNCKCNRLKRTWLFFSSSKRSFDSSAREARHGSSKHGSPNASAVGIWRNRAGSSIIFSKTVPLVSITRVDIAFYFARCDTFHFEFLESLFDHHKFRKTKKKKKKRSESLVIFRAAFFFFCTREINHHRDFIDTFSCNFRTRVERARIRENFEKGEKMGKEIIRRRPILVKIVLV